MNFSQAIKPGFADPVHDCQAVFRAVLQAMSRPGSIIDVPAGGIIPPAAWLSPALVAAALTLFDHDTPIWITAGSHNDEAAAHLGTYLRFHCGCPLSEDPGSAAFAIISAPRAEDFPLPANPGRDLDPWHATTVMLQVPELRGGPPRIVAGPGIAATHTVRAAGLPESFWEEIAANRDRFPAGFDFLLFSGTEVLGLPRSTVLREISPCT
ncbi:MAG: phosphonate C-P lyase system protein PhnH [Deltaproteobacteria bacterium]|nr:phosphonate C-P lyase system protein PhnH [Candidatus Anaeroferrophillacea bacterium]